jgi:imidazole glycerol-phosphate synthase subunit HisH
MIAIVKYNAGNITSVQNALTRLGYESIVTDDDAIIKNASKVVFPGVGEASSAMQFLKDKKLDILLGLQLMCKYSEENDTTCLGIFDTEVKLFAATEIVPHMGWNNISFKQNELLNEIKEISSFYFVHSYYAAVCESTIATCNYINEFGAVMQKNNFYATQFHPEKSGSDGEIILKNFLEIIQ